MDREIKTVLALGAAFIGAAAPAWANSVTELVSVGPHRVQGNSDSFADKLGLSQDGRFVGFISGAAVAVLGDTNGIVDLFVRDRASHETTRVNVGFERASRLCAAGRIFQRG